MLAFCGTRLELRLLSLHPDSASVCSMRMCAVHAGGARRGRGVRHLMLRRACRVESSRVE